MKEGLIKELQVAKSQFDKSSSCLGEEDSHFKPKEGMYSVTNHVAHAALSIDWFMDGMFNPKGFDLDFESHIKQVMSINSLNEARSLFDKAINNATDILQSKSDEELSKPFVGFSSFQGPRFIILSAITEHTAHHRGALTVYSRLLGKAPQMPYNM